MSKFLYSVNGIIPFDNVDYIECDDIDGDITANTKFNDCFVLIGNCSQAHLRLIMHDFREFLLYSEDLCFDFTKYYKKNERDDSNGQNNNN